MKPFKKKSRKEAFIGQGRRSSTAPLMELIITVHKWPILFGMVNIQNGLESKKQRSNNTENTKFKKDPRLSQW